MENYIVRIYRRDPEDPKKIAGMVEHVGIDQGKSFTSIDELKGILVSADQRPFNKRKKVKKM